MKKYSFIVLIFVVATITSSAQIKKVDAVGITVKDLAVSERFYSAVLGFHKISDQEFYGEPYEKLEGLFGIRMHVVRMQLGDEIVELTDYLTSGGRSIPEDFRSNDLSFQHIAIVVSDMDKAYTQLRKHMTMQVSTGPQTIPKTNVAAAGVKAFYFHDPDMHNLELIYFPKGKGQAKWQDAKGKLFLGIDHTAIAVSNTDSSLHFYQTLLGLDRKGDSWNMGMEQAHLNNVENASLHITGLRASQGAGIEFLQYLLPGPGKAFPSDSRADDIWYWQTSMITDDAEALYLKLQKAGYTFVSKGLTELHNKNGQIIRAFIVKDPDGHAMLIEVNCYFLTLFF